MSPVEFWCTTDWGTPIAVELERVFGTVANKQVIIVESQDEYDYCWSMQLMMGSEINIIIHESGKTVQDYLRDFFWVFTTWDPADRNRI